MRVTVLGCGGSLGVPIIGGGWGRCDPTNPKNRRLRASILVQTETTAVLVDTSPDLRQQLLTTDVSRLDGVLFTHDHADHTHGLDDLRPLTYGNNGPIAGYMDETTQRQLEQRFGYALSSVDLNRGFYRPIVEPRRLNGPMRIGDLDVMPFDQDHGITRSTGFRFGPFAYSTDVVALSNEAFEALDGVHTWMVDATREEPHVSHAHLALTLEWIERLRPQRAILTHMNQLMDYDTLMAKLPPGVEPAYDGMTLTF